VAGLFCPPVAERLFSEEYDRERRAPRPGDGAYVHLKDLADALVPRLRGASGAWLDFGSGSSPYAGFAPGAEMLRADLRDQPEAPRPDFLLEVGEPCPAESHRFDGILSTQVLEHVPDAGFYLRDALRMLRPGGELLLTTHGIWEEHRFPIDVGRWTAEGLRSEVSRAGFEVNEVVPLSCGIRGVLPLMLYELRRVPHWGNRYRSPVGAYLGALRALYRYRPDSIDRFSDRFFGDRALGTEGEDLIYLTLLVSARKP
jgi:SAM-dependent methyltransferase